MSVARGVLGLPVFRPDPQCSAAVLIGQGRFRSDGLPDLPQASRNARALAEALTGVESGFAWSRCAVLSNPSSASVFASLAAAATSTTDVLLVYYAGHGLLDEDGRLHLALEDTDPDFLALRTLSAQVLAELLRGSRARHQVVVLDCAYSAGVVTAIADRGVRDGVSCQVLHSSGPNDETPPPTRPDSHTAFTALLLDILGHDRAHGGERLTLPGIHRRIRESAAPAGATAGLWQSGRGGQVDLRPARPEGWTPDSARAQAVEEAERNAIMPLVAVALCLILVFLVLSIPGIAVGIIDSRADLTSLPVTGTPFTLNIDTPVTAEPGSGSAIAFVTREHGWALFGGQEAVTRLSLPPGHDYYVTAGSALDQAGTCPGAAAVHVVLEADGATLLDAHERAAQKPITLSYLHLGHAAAMVWRVTAEGSPSCQARFGLTDAALHTAPSWLWHADVLKAEP